MVRKTSKLPIRMNNLSFFVTMQYFPMYPYLKMFFFPLFYVYMLSDIVDPIVAGIVSFVYLFMLQEYKLTIGQYILSEIIFFLIFYFGITPLAQKLSFFNELYSMRVSQIIQFGLSMLITFIGMVIPFFGILSKFSIIRN